MSTADERERRRRDAERDHAHQEAGVPYIPTRRETRNPTLKPAKGYLKDRRYRRIPPPPTDTG